MPSMRSHAPLGTIDTAVLALVRSADKRVDDFLQPLHFGWGTCERLQQVANCIEDAKERRRDHLEPVERVLGVLVQLHVEEDGVGACGHASTFGSMARHAMHDVLLKKHTTGAPGWSSAARIALS